MFVANGKRNYDNNLCKHSSISTNDTRHFGIALNTIRIDIERCGRTGAEALGEVVQRVDRALRRRLQPSCQRFARRRTGPNRLTRC